MIDDYLTEINILKAFDKGSGLKRNMEITGQVLGSLVEYCKFTNWKIYHLLILMKMALTSKTRKEVKEDN